MKALHICRPFVWNHLPFWAAGIWNPFTPNLRGHPTSSPWISWCGSIQLLGKLKSINFNVCRFSRGKLNGRRPWVHHTICIGKPLVVCWLLRQQPLLVHATPPSKLTSSSTLPRVWPEASDPCGRLSNNSPELSHIRWIETEVSCSRFFRSTASWFRFVIGMLKIWNQSSKIPSSWKYYLKAELIHSQAEVIDEPDHQKQVFGILLCSCPLKLELQPFLMQIWTCAHPT